MLGQHFKYEEYWLSCILVTKVDGNGTDVKARLALAHGLPNLNTLSGLNLRSKTSLQDRGIKKPFFKKLLHFNHLGWGDKPKMQQDELCIFSFIGLG